jgi:hypothetical protein
MKKIALALSLASLLWGVEPPTPEPFPLPWLTGPLLTPSGHVIPTGHINMEPYLYWTITRGQYGADWRANSVPRFTSINGQYSFQLGVAPSTEFDWILQGFYNSTQGVSSWCLGDIPIALSFQLLDERPGDWYPAIKLRFGGNLPIGRYQRLSPHKKKTDAGGSGSFLPGAGLVFTRLYHLTRQYYLATRFFLNYTLPTPVHVHGASAYGGNRQTRGKVFPPQIFLSLLGLEATLSRNWALALDVQYDYTTKGRFSGKAAGATMTSPHSQQLALAPAIEYNWSENLGLIGGAWFSVAGQNSSQFVSWVVAINIYR